MRPSRPGASRSLLPVYIAEACQTGGRTIYAIALINYLLFERGFGAGETGIISSFYNLGFLACTFLAGVAIDRLGRERLLAIVTAIVFSCSAYYLLPIERGVSIVILVIVRGIDGGATGIFWSAVQSYAKKLADIDVAARDTFTSKYNFSWNAGVIAGTVAGWLVTAETSTNVIGFYMSFAIAGIQLVAVLCMRREQPGEYATDVQGVKPAVPPRSLSPEELHTMAGLPMLMVFLSLLTHSFTTGGLTIFLPAKIKAFSLPSFVTYIFFFEQSLAQTASITAGGKIKERFITPSILAGPAIIALGWLLVGIGTDGLAISAGILVQSIMQGILYAAGMRYLTNIAQATGDAGLFSRFQFVMGFGRTAGPFIFGLLIELGMEVAYTATVIFDVAVFASAAIVLVVRRKNIVTTSRS